MKDEYIIISKTSIQQRIEELDKLLQLRKGSRVTIEYHLEINVLKQILSQSTPLIPEIEKAFDAGRTVKNYKDEWKQTYFDDMTSAKYEETKDYISNLKLDV